MDAIPGANRVIVSLDGRDYDPLTMQQLERFSDSLLHGMAKDLDIGDPSDPVGREARTLRVALEGRNKAAFEFIYELYRTGSLVSAAPLIPAPHSVSYDQLYEELGFFQLLLPGLHEVLQKELQQNAEAQGSAVTPIPAAFHRNAASAMILLRQLAVHFSAKKTAVSMTEAVAQHMREQAMKSIQEDFKLNRQMPRSMSSDLHSTGFIFIKYGEIDPETSLQVFTPLRLDDWDHADCHALTAHGGGRLHYCTTCFKDGTQRLPWGVQHVTWRKGSSNPTPPTEIATLQALVSSSGESMGMVLSPLMQALTSQGYNVEAGNATVFTAHAECKTCLTLAVSW
mmetsp:Transcript_16361/g.35363  ORF Transcript_16361/g.35363 Transcript_16361/m.35363 type:complete len:340 (+) Transcript_16361:285-1304(+)|eukprot:CAMPEP_0202921850 /NCGR_PEP_ID=MMETSP1392-20130828/77616_1 /ASSEMBLY_ACC=CAM_ASM_000868 /TAXON_ID=225041 /ORGANISM="Chlamydomonas chlamydogama, Strain SAG 11-48b" /LENGTH=339 /DNA_ID=CAMNT_0049615449 /DNA_START=230 /DNA_END=1249 /DNA_ORIENTATION=+